MPQKKTTSVTAFEAKLKSACKELTYISEIDSAVTTVFGKLARSNSPADLLSAIGVSPPADVEESDFSNFFARLIDQKAWFGPAQRKNAKRFEALKHILEHELTALKVFRTGKIQITIYVLGIDKDGVVAGVKMSAVET